MTETRTIENWVVIDYGNCSTRTRKNEPKPSSLGKHEVATRMRVDVVVPEPDIEPLTARVEVPAATVTDTDLEDLDADDVRDWRDVATDMMGDVAGRYTSLPAEDAPVDWGAWNAERAGHVLDVLKNTPGNPDPEAVEDHLEACLQAHAAAGPDDDPVELLWGDDHAE